MASAKLEEAAGILEHGGQAEATAELAEETVLDLHIKIVSQAHEYHSVERMGERRRQRFFVTKAQVLDREVRRGMNEGAHPKLSVSLPSFHYAPQGETAMNIDLVLLIGKQFLDTR